MMVCDCCHRPLNEESEISKIKTVKQFFEYLYKDDFMKKDIETIQVSGIKVMLSNALVQTINNKELDDIRKRLLHDYCNLMGL